MLAPPTIRAIVRFDISDPVPLPAGLVVLTSARICDPDVDVYRFPAIRESHPERVLYLYPKALLPVSMFLARQPSSQFWFIVHRARWNKGQPDCFLSDPWKCDAGPRPFRFESEGEALFYLQEHEINLRNVLLGQMGLKQAGARGEDDKRSKHRGESAGGAVALPLAQEIARRFRQVHAEPRRRPVPACQEKDVVGGFGLDAGDLRDRSGSESNRT